MQERRKQDFWDDVEQQEKISKEAAAVARELNTQRKVSGLQALATLPVVMSELIIYWYSIGMTYFACRTPHCSDPLREF